jgi:DNA polymerase-1
MELAGVSIDTKVMNELSKKITKQIKEVSTDIYQLAGKEFNISSPLQLREILFEELQIPVLGIKKGKTGLSTSAESLEKLRDMHPIIEKVEEYREICKLQNTYIDVLPTLVNSKTGRIHAKFNQTVAATGRLSSSDPNLQNIPIRTELGREIRKAFVAEKGNLLVSADYSQLELRIVASLAEDKKMMDIFDKNLDIHAATAAAINGISLDKVTKEMRYAAKEVNFGVLYGMGVYGLAWRARISRQEAKDFITKYFEEFSGVKKYIDRTLEFAKKEGYCETLFGRRRYIPELSSTNHQVRAAAERMATNHPIQGTEADMIKMAMVKIHQELSNLKMILQVHDELVFEIPEDFVEEAKSPIKKIMEGVVKLRVPVQVEIHSGKNWEEAH